ncbi:unnamed protein product, partial [Pneumocystis jirovecii]
MLSKVIESISPEALHSKQIYVITRFFCGCLDDQSFLKEILIGLKCVSANDELSSYSIPSLIDKYDFSPINTKKDIIDMLSFCMETYSPDVIETYIIQIWNMLKNEIFEKSDDDLVKKSLDCLFIISKVFSQEISKNSENTSLIKFLTPISDEINKHFEEPGTKTAKNSIKILYSLSSASKYAFELLFEHCIPSLLSRFEKEDSINTKAAILEFISFFLLSALYVYNSYNKEINEGIPINSILMKEKNRLFTILSNSLTTPFFSNKYTRAAAIHALLTFSEIHSLLQYDEVKLIVQYFNDIVLKEENNLKAEALEALVKIAETKPNLILETTFSSFLKLLSETDSATISNNCSLPLNEIILTVLSHLCVEKQLFNIFISHILNTFDIISDLKSNYLIALSYVIQNTPKHIILPELASVLPLLLQCFSLDDYKLKVSNINILYIITLESSDLIIEHLGSLIPFLLTFSTEKHNNDINVQIAALKCLGLFPTILKTEFILPFKNTVIRKLVEVLDDPKR